MMLRFPRRAAAAGLRVKINQIIQVDSGGFSLMVSRLFHCVRHPSISRSHIFLYLDITDKGSDQQCRKRLTSEAIAESGCPNVIYMPGICFLHMYNAAVKQGLELVDSLLTGLFSKDTLAGFTKYFGSISKVVNCWREQASNIMMAWDEDYQREDVSILKLGRRYPLSVVSGRWGSIESAEDYLLLRTRERVVPTVLRVLSKHMKAQSDRPCSPSLFRNNCIFELRWRRAFFRLL